MNNYWLIYFLELGDFRDVINSVIKNLSKTFNIVFMERVFKMQLGKMAVIVIENYILEILIIRY